MGDLNAQTALKTQGLFGTRLGGSPSADTAEVQGREPKQSLVCSRTYREMAFRKTGANSLRQISDFLAFPQLDFSRGKGGHKALKEPKSHLWMPAHILPIGP